MSLFISHNYKILISIWSTKILSKAVSLEPCNVFGVIPLKLNGWIPNMSMFLRHYLFQTLAFCLMLKFLLCIQISNFCLLSRSVWLVHVIKPKVPQFYAIKTTQDNCATSLKPFNGSNLSSSSKLSAICHVEPVEGYELGHPDRFGNPWANTQSPGRHDQGEARVSYLAHGLWSAKVQKRCLLSPRALRVIVPQKNIWESHASAIIHVRLQNHG